MWTSVYISPVCQSPFRIAVHSISWIYCFWDFTYARKTYFSFAFFYASRSTDIWSIYSEIVWERNARNRSHYKDCWFCFQIDKKKKKRTFHPAFVYCRFPRSFDEKSSWGFTRIFRISLPRRSFPKRLGTRNAFRCFVAQTTGTEWWDEVGNRRYTVYK